MNFETALDIVYQAIDVVNGQRPADQRVSKTPDIILTGENGVLDSLGLVTLVLAVEQRINAATGVEIDLTGHEAFAEDATSAQTPSSIAALIVKQVS